MVNFSREDLEVAEHSNLPVLHRVHTVPRLSADTLDVLKVCLRHKFCTETKKAQKKGLLPPSRILQRLPLFQEALAEDAEYEARLAAEESRREEMKRKEEENRRQAAEARATAAAKRRAEERKRERQLLLKKREEMYIVECRRFEAMLQRWERTIEERRSRWEEARVELDAVNKKKADVEKRLKELAGEKTSLMAQLRALASTPNVASDGGRVDASTSGRSPARPTPQPQEQLQAQRDERRSKNENIDAQMDRRTSHVPDRHFDRHRYNHLPSEMPRSRSPHGERQWHWREDSYPPSGRRDIDRDFRGRGRYNHPGRSYQGNRGEGSDRFQRSRSPPRGYRRFN
jgi:hypothetical protein